MLKNFLLISLRSIIKNKGGAYLNLLGLTFGMAACLYIFSYLYLELTYDSTEKDETIARVETHNYNGETLTSKSAFTSQQAGPLLSKLSGINNYTQLQPFTEEGSALFKLPLSDSTSEKLYVQTAYFTDLSIFDVFAIDLLQGTRDLANEQANTIFVSSSTVNYIIKKTSLDLTSLIGKELKSGSLGILSDTYVIKGVFEDRPENTHLPFDALIINPSARVLSVEQSTEDTYTYVSMTSSRDLPSTLPIQDDLTEKQLFLRAIDEIHTTSEISNEPTSAANSGLLLFLGLIGLVIMLLACTNYINNAIINSIYRAKEIGIRKVLGIRPSQLIVTFMGEALLVNIIAAVLGLGLFQLAMKWTLQWTNIGSSISGEVSTDVQLLFLLALLLLTTILSSLYPAYYLSSLNPIAALRSKINIMDSDQMGGANSIIKSLLVFQLGASILFVSSVYIVYKQLNYLETKEKQPFDFRVSGIFPGASGVGELFGELAIGFIDELERGGMIEEVHLSNLSKGNVKTAQLISLLHPEDPHFDSERNDFNFYVVDFSFWGHDRKKFLAGKNFNVDFGKDPNNLILNESAMKQLGYSEVDSLIGKQLKTKGGIGIVIGVVKNQANSEPPSVYATGFRFRTFIDLTVNYPGQAGESVIRYLEKVEHLLGSRLPFLYFFDRGYQQQRTVENTMLGLFSFFSILAIVISSIGMVGLSYFVTQKRTKEIGVRKILGAPTANILMVLLFDFLKLILYACLLALPIIIIGSKFWLNNYAYRITIGPATLGLPLLLIFFICLSVILEKCWKAASASPISVLHD